MRILLIEDERKVADIVARGLRAEHYAVDLAHDGTSGWEMASSLDYDLIVLDLMLPGLSGTEVLREKKFPVSSGRNGSLFALEQRIIRRLINKGFKRSEFKREHFIVRNNDFAKTMFLSIVDYELSKGL